MGSLTDSYHSSSDNEVLYSKNRGKEDANLRIMKLERVMKHRKGMTKAIRKKLQSRHHTTIFRLKRDNNLMHSDFIKYELNFI